MTYLRLFLALLLVAALALPAMAQPIPLAELSRYLNSLTTVESDFTQINADGSIATGKLMIQRPGRVRFEYSPPHRDLVLASGGQVAIFDAKSNQPPTQYPLARTPLNLILAPRINLSQARMVAGHRSDGSMTILTAQDPDHPEYGTIQMIFSANPTELRQWIITDEAGSQTTVILDEMEKGGVFPASAFNISHETNRRLNR